MSAQLHNNCASWQRANDPRDDSSRKGSSRLFFLLRHTHTRRECALKKVALCNIAPNCNALARTNPIIHTCKRERERRRLSACARVVIIMIVGFKLAELRLSLSQPLKCLLGRALNSLRRRRRRRCWRCCCATEAALKSNCRVARRAPAAS